MQPSEAPMHDADLRALRVEGHGLSPDLSFDEQAHFRLQLAALTASADRRAAIESEAAHVGRRNAKHRRA